MSAPAPYAQTITRVREQITATFDDLDLLFDQPAALRTYIPADGGWSVDDLLEHITLTSHFLLIVIRNGAATCRKRAARQPILPGESDLDQLAQIGHPDAFPWLRPAHMEPQRLQRSDEVRAAMRVQRADCLAILEQLGDGAGSLHRVRMSVQALGKLDMYQWLFFLAQHAARHAVEIARVSAEFRRADAD